MKHLRVIYIGASGNNLKDLYKDCRACDDALPKFKNATMQERAEVLDEKEWLYWYIIDEETNKVITEGCSHHGSDCDTALQGVCATLELLEVPYLSDDDDDYYFSDKEMKEYCEERGIEIDFD